MNKKLKTLSITLILAIILGLVIPAAEIPEIPGTATTVEAATRRLRIKVKKPKVYAGKKTKLSVRTAPKARIYYRSSNRKIATVSSKGVVTGKRAGTVKITIAARKWGYRIVRKTITVKVRRQNQKITASSQKLTVGQKKNLKAKAKTSLSYKSSNTKVVTVDRKGNLKAVGEGTAKVNITAKATGIYNKASRTVTVKTEAVHDPVEEPVDTPEPTETPENPAPTESPDEPETPAPSETPVPAEPETPVPEPTETPLPTEAPQPTPAPEISYVTMLRIEKTEDDILYFGEPKSCNLIWTATGNTTKKDFIYTSEDPSIATVDEDGNITGLQKGKVKITVTSKTPFSPAAGARCLSTSKRYTVQAHYNSDYAGVGFPYPKDYELKGRNVGVGETINPIEDDTTAYSQENMEKYLEFSSSDPSIATIDARGNITGVSTGYVTLTVKTKLPIDAAGTYYDQSSVVYHVGDYTYEEILEGLTMDTVAGKTAHDVMNDLRQHPEKRNFFKEDKTSYPAREWDNGILRNAVTRASRNIVCVMLGGWAENEMSTINPLASHGGAFNGYGSEGWENTGEDLGKAASVFFEDPGHYGNETDPYFKYEAVAVVQYKNAAGINLTSLIVDASGYSYKDLVLDYQKRGDSYIKQCIKVSKIPENQYYDFCNHFNLPTTDVLDVDETESSSLSSNINSSFTDGASESIVDFDDADTPGNNVSSISENTEETDLDTEE